MIQTWPRSCLPSLLTFSDAQVQMVDAADTTAPTPERFFVDCIQPGEVVFISQPQGYYSACWGGLMSTRSKYLGARGVVIDGNFRDILEHRELAFFLYDRPIR